MKIVIILLTLSIALSCRNKNQFDFKPDASTDFVLVSEEKIALKHLFGSWKTQDIIQLNPSDDITDKITYYEDGTWSLQMFLNGVQLENHKGEYTVDHQSKTLTTKFEDTSFVFSIKKLTKKQLYLQDTKTGTVTQYIRY